MFHDSDLMVRKALRFLLILQLVELIPLGVVVFLGQRTLAQVLLRITLLLGLSALGLVYLRYRGNPKVVEKRSLMRRKRMLEKGIRAEQQRISLTQQKRISLTKAQQSDAAAALESVQRTHIEQGLSSTTVAEADISGVGPKLKDRLVARGMGTAADVDQRALSRVEGFGDTKSAAVLRWRDGVHEYLDITKPTALSAERAGQIDAKYKAQHAANDNQEAHAKATKAGLENDLAAHLPMLEPLAGISFPNYVTTSMSANTGRAGKMVAGLLGTTVFLSGVAGVGLLGVAGRAAPAPPTLDYSAIGTSAFQTALASQLGTLQASSPTANPSMTDAPLATATQTIEPTPASFPGVAGAFCIPNNSSQTGKVVSIVDGDTIRVLLDRDGLIYSLRYIGIDTPEMNPAGQTFAAEVNARNTELAYGKSVLLIKDVSETDPYGRLLRYVIADGVFVNYELVAGGFAGSVSYPPDTACNTTFKAVEQQAAAAQIGLWAALPTLIPLPTTSGLNVAPGPTSGVAPSSSSGGG